MNLRELIKTLKSPGSRAIICIAVIILAIIISIPFLAQKDESHIEVVKPDKIDQKAIVIDTNVPALQVDKNYVAPKEKPALVGKASDPPVITQTSPADTVKTNVNVAVRQEASPDADSQGALSGKRGRGYRQIHEEGAGNNYQLLVIDGENDGKNNTENDVFLSDRYAPYGRLISCKLVNTLESNIPNTPVIAFVTESLYWQNSKGEKQLIIPAGTEVLGTCGGPSRNRMNTGTSWNLVWQISSPNNMVGVELQLQGIALEKSHQPGRKDLAAITDMSAGIPGQIIENKTLDEIMMYFFGALQGASQGFQKSEVYETENSTIVANDGSTRNAVAMAFESVAQIGLQQVADRIAKESYYIRVAAGTDFYLYVTQVIDLDQARIANSQFSPQNMAVNKDEANKSADILTNYQKQVNTIQSFKPRNNQIRRQVF